MEQPPVQIGQYVLGKNLGIGAFGKVRLIFVADTSNAVGECNCLLI
jgi:5'-AMP-activated protein kinase catalytic alpha subunit